MSDDRHGISTQGVPEHLDDLISNARQSVDLACPINTAEALAAGSVPFVVRATRRGVRCRLCVRRAPGAKLSAAFQDVVQFYTNCAWETRVCAVPAYNDGYVVVDDHHGMVFDSGHIELTAREPEVLPLRAHFYTAWTRADEPLYQPLYEDLVQPSSPELILPFVAEQQYWDNLIPRLALNPTDLDSIDPLEFERLVAELMRRDGYSDVTLTSQTRDGGFDMFAVTDTALGRHMYLVECKHYKRENPVGVSLVRNLYGVMEAERATKALLVTTSYFTKGAIGFQERAPHRLALTDYENLVDWLRRVNR
jgi:hypothetical protein